jgi:hypothetical protein
VTGQGLAWQRWLDPVDEFVRQHRREPSRWAIACTYELELATLQRAVLPALSRRGAAFRTLVLVDAGVLERVMNDLAAPLVGAVNLHAVRVTRGGVFHPKLLLLRAGGHVRVCFGSANLTSGGLAGNLELWSHSDSADVVPGVTAFFDELLAAKAVVLDPSARRGLRRALLGLPRRATPAVWSSLTEPFAHRLARRGEPRARRAVIVSPLFATAGGLTAARSAVPAGDVTLCTDRAIALSRCKVRVLRGTTDAETESGDPAPQALHAKAYAFEARDGSANVWSGSANFTAQAVTKSVAQGGNVELMVRAHLPRDEWQRLAHDLENDLFVAMTGRPELPPVQGAAMPAARSTVIGAELVIGVSGPALLITSTRASGVVRLAYQRRTVTIPIRAGRGRLEGAPLRAFLGAIATAIEASTCFAIHELLGRSRFAVVVNIPHVPPTAAEGGSGHATLDAFANELLGRVIVYARPPGVAADDGDPDLGSDVDAEDDGGAPLDAELERRLDECRHQGRLDRDAVTLAVLEKRLRKAHADQRTAYRGEIVQTAEATLPPLLHAAVRRLFRTERGR